MWYSHSSVDIKCRMSNVAWESLTSRADESSHCLILPSPTQSLPEPTLFFPFPCTVRHLLCVDYHKECHITSNENHDLQPLGSYDVTCEPPLNRSTNSCQSLQCVHSLSLWGQYLDPRQALLMPPPLEASLNIS